MDGETEVVEEVEVEETEPVDDKPTKAESSEDWKRNARSLENQLRKERKARETLEAKAKEHEDATKSAHEKALDGAKDEAYKAAKAEADKERRADRLETATVRLAAKGLKAKDADGNEITVRFADPDDAHTYIERAIRRGDIDEDDIFDDNGKVKSSGLSEALGDILDSKPHLAESDGKPRKSRGSVDAGKGTASTRNDEDLSSNEWLNRIQKRN